VGLVVRRGRLDAAVTYRPGKRRRTARVAIGRLTIDGATIRGRYPRRGDGRANHRAAATLAAA
jgi:hypothetical protein